MIALMPIYELGFLHDRMVLLLIPTGLAVVVGVGRVARGAKGRI